MNLDFRSKIAMTVVISYILLLGNLRHHYFPVVVFLSAALAGEKVCGSSQRFGLARACYPDADFSVAPTVFFSFRSYFSLYEHGGLEDGAGSDDGAL